MPSIFPQIPHILLTAWMALSPIAHAVSNDPRLPAAAIEADWRRQELLRHHPGSRIIAAEEDAAGAVDGIKTGQWGFHTAHESNPWWQVDLGEITPVDRGGACGIGVMPSPRAMIGSNCGFPRTGSISTRSTNTRARRSAGKRISVRFSSC